MESTVSDKKAPYSATPATILLLGIISPATYGIIDFDGGDDFWFDMQIVI